MTIELDSTNPYMEFYLVKILNAWMNLLVWAIFLFLRDCSVQKSGCLGALYYSGVYITQ